jgi:hypothetical protein
VNEAGFRANVFCERGSKGYDIVAGGALDLFDSIDGESGFATYDVDCFSRDGSHFGVDFADGYFDIEPFLKSVFFRPDRAHFGPRVSFDHFTFRFKLCSGSN